MLKQTQTPWPDKRRECPGRCCARNKPSSPPPAPHRDNQPTSRPAGVQVIQGVTQQIGEDLFQSSRSLPQAGGNGWQEPICAAALSDGARHRLQNPTDDIADFHRLIMILHPPRPYQSINDTAQPLDPRWINCTDSVTPWSRRCRPAAGLAGQRFVGEQQAGDPVRLGVIPG